MKHFAPRAIESRIFRSIDALWKTLPAHVPDTCSSRSVAGTHAATISPRPRTPKKRIGKDGATLCRRLI